MVAKGEAGLPSGATIPRDGFRHLRTPGADERKRNARYEHRGLGTACIGLGTGAYTEPLPARMGVSPMFALGPVATIGSGGPRTAFS